MSLSPVLSAALSAATSASGVAFNVDSNGLLIGNQRPPGCRGLGAKLNHARLLRTLNALPVTDLEGVLAQRDPIGVLWRMVKAVYRNAA